MVPHEDEEALDFCSAMEIHFEYLLMTIIDSLLYFSCFRARRPKSIRVVKYNTVIF